MGTGIWVLCLCMSVGVMGSVYLGPGNVVEEDGELWMIEDYMYVSVNLECISRGPQDLKELNKSLSEVRIVFKGLQSRNHTVAKIGPTLENIGVAVDRVQGKLDTAAEWFPGLMGEVVEAEVTTMAPRRRKRMAPVILAGAAMVAVAGVSIAALVKVEQVQAEVERMGQELEVMNQNVENIQGKVKEVVDGLSQVQSKLEELSSDFDTMVGVAFLQSLLSNIEQDIHFVLECVHTQAELVRDSVRGVVSPKLIPVGKLDSILRKASYKYGFISMFKGKELWSYYGVLRGMPSMTGIVVEIPMSTKNRFFKYDVNPFPTFHDADVQKWKSSKKILIKSKRYYACLDEYVLDSCVRVWNRTVCSHPRFAVKYSKPPYDCCFELAMNGTDLSMCEFVKHPNAPTLLLLRRYVAVFFPESTRIEVTCQSSPPKAKKMIGTSVVSDGCSLSTKRFFYPGSRVQHDMVKAPEFVAHKMAATSNLSYLLLPEGFKFKKIQQLVVVHRADAWMRFFPQRTTTILLLVLAGMVVLTLGGILVRACFRRNRRMSTLPRDFEMHAVVGGHRIHDVPSTRSELGQDSGTSSSEDRGSSSSVRPAVDVNVIHRSL